MRNSMTFDAFGKQYRMTQFPAVLAMDFINRSSDMSPVEILQFTELKLGNDWISLADRKVVNENVTDITGHMNPKYALSGLCNIVAGYSFGFLKTWKATKIPKRLSNESESVHSEYMDPIISNIIQEGIATLRELEEYYSLEDAFKMFDVLVVKGLNKALAYEAAERDAKNSKKR